MKIYLFIIVLATAGLNVFGQTIERREADSLLRVLSKSKSAERATILIRLAQFHIFKPGENQFDFDSASRYIAEARRLNESLKSLSLTGQLLMTESFMAKEKGQQEAAKSKLEEAIKILQAGDDKYSLGKALYELSGYYGWLDSANYANKVNLVEQSVTAFQQSNGLLEKAEALKTLGFLYNIARDPEGAIEELKMALAAYDSANHKAVQEVYDMLGGIYLYDDKYKQAAYYELLAIKTAETCKDTTILLCQIYTRLGVLYAFSGRYDESLKYFEEALDVAIKYDDRNLTSVAVFNIARAFIAVTRPQELLDFISGIPAKSLIATTPTEKAFFAMSYLQGYLGTSQYQKAKQFCDIIVNLVDDSSIPYNFREIMYRLAASYYLEVKQFSTARLFLTRNKPLVTLTKSTRATASNEKLWYKLDSAEGHYNSAFYHLLTFKALSDSALNEMKSRNMQQLEVEHETTQKEDSLRQKNQHISLLLQTNSLQRTNLKQANLIKNITIGGIVFTLIVLGLLYYQFRKNKKNSKIILQKGKQLEDMLAEKEWWLKEVHHRVKNNLHTIICLLESQAMYLEKDALQAIEKSQHRIYAMSLIHQKLYQNEDIKSIDMSVYLDEFIGYLKDSLDADRIEFITEVEPIQLNLTQAIPVGLIINEAVTNSIKYAFTDPADARIIVSMSETDGIVNLRIADNGKGFVPTEETETKGLGIQLIKGLSKEIRGSLSIKGDNGTKIAIQFKKDIITSTEQIMHRELASYEA